MVYARMILRGIIIVAGIASFVFGLAIVFEYGQMGAFPDIFSKLLRAGSEPLGVGQRWFTINGRLLGGLLLLWPLLFLITGFVLCHLGMGRKRVDTWPGVSHGL